MITKQMRRVYYTMRINKQQQWISFSCPHWWCTSPTAELYPLELMGRLAPLTQISVSNENCRILGFLCLNVMMYGLN